MRKKAISYSDTYKHFNLECGHISPLFIHARVNIAKTMERLHTGKLYRDCSMCQREANRLDKQDADA